MRPIMRLILGLGALLLILAGAAVALPSYVTVARTVVINAPESAVFPYLSNLRRFNTWSPWAARDPQLQATFSGPEEGEGAKIDWTSSQRAIGDGSMSITKSNPNRHIDMDVAINGLEGAGYFDVAPAGSGSKVTWGFGYETGSSPMKRWKGLMLDRFIGSEYQNGLAKLKAHVEADRRPMAPNPATMPQMMPQPDSIPIAPEGQVPVAPPAAQAATQPAPAAQAAPPPAQSTAPKKRQQ